jgi:hypothetical protein
MNGTKRAVNACIGCIAAGQNKSPAPLADARQKKSPVSNDRVKCFLFGRFKQR